MNDKICLKNMVFYAFHGAHTAEQELGQRFYVDIEMKLDAAKASKSDQLADTVNYVDVYEKTKNIVENNRFQLLEFLSAKIADEVLKVSLLLSEVTVRIRKPSVPIAGMLDYVEIELSKVRS